MRLRTERLTLRDFEKQDLEAVLAYRERSHQKRPWLGLGGRSVAWLNGEIEEVPTGSRPEEVRLAILLSSKNQLIGACRIRLTDPEHGEAELLLDFDPQHLREGYATEAAVDVVRLGFEELRLQRICSWCISQDASTAQILERAGMRLDDVLPRSLWIQGRWWNTLVYSIRESEWAAQSVEETTTRCRTRGTHESSQ